MIWPISQHAFPQDRSEEKEKDGLGGWVNGQKIDGNVSPGKKP